MSMNTITRDWNWWAHLFRVTHRQAIPDIDRYDDELVAFIVETLDLRPGDRLLDLGCGSGVHALRLAQRGIQVVGLDIAPSLVEYATNLVREADVSSATFVVGDMRDPLAALAPLGLADSPGFQAVTILSTSFGFLGEAGDRATLQAAARVLLPGGKLFLDLTDPASLMLPREKWWSELDGGFMLMEAWYDPSTCVHEGTFRYFDRDGNLNVCAEPERIRVYSLPELTALLRNAGLPLRAAYGNSSLPPRAYGLRHHERMLVVGRKPQPGFDEVHA
jgi:SAM-dependent methyltransferase